MVIPVQAWVLDRAKSDFRQLEIDNQNSPGPFPKCPPSGTANHGTDLASYVFDPTVLPHQLNLTAWYPNAKNMTIVAIAVPVSMAACNKSKNEQIRTHVHRKCNRKLTIVTFPPVECPLANQIVENETNNKPQGILGYWISTFSKFPEYLWYLLVFAGGMLPAALKKIGTLMYRIQLLG